MWYYLTADHLWFPFESGWYLPPGDEYRQYLLDLLYAGIEETPEGSGWILDPMP